MKIFKPKECPFCTVVNKHWLYCDEEDRHISIWEIDVIECRKCRTKLDLNPKTRFNINEDDFNDIKI